MKYFKLSDIAEIVIGRTPSRSNQQYWGNDHKWVTISDMKSKVVSDTKESISNIAVEKVHRRKILKGTLLLSFKLSIGKLAFAGCDLFTNEAIAALEIKNKITVHPEYLYYALKYIPLVGSNQAAMGKTLNSKSLAQLQIPLPKNYDDQIRIVTILAHVENLIEKRKESVQLLDDFLKSTFLEIFGDPRTNEKNWAFDAVIKSVDCIVPGRDKPKSFTGNIPWVTTKDLEHLSTTFKSKSSIGLNQAEIKKVRAKVIPQGSVIMTCVGDLGVVSVAGIAMVVNQQLHTFQCNNGIINTFLMFVLSFQTKYMYKMASKTTVPYMNKTTCNGIPVIKPPLKLQKKFAIFVKKIELIKEKYKRSLLELKCLYSSVSQLAFKGQLDLSKIPIDTTNEFTTISLRNKLKASPKIVDKKVHTKKVFSKKTLIAFITKKNRRPFKFEDFWNEIMDHFGKNTPEYNQIRDIIFEMIENGLLTQEFDTDEKEMMLRGLT